MAPCSCPEIFYENKIDKQKFYKKGPKGHFSNPLVKCGDMIIQFTTFLCRKKHYKKYLKLTGYQNCGRSLPQLCGQF